MPRVARTDECNQLMGLVETNQVRPAKGGFLMVLDSYLSVLNTASWNPAVT